MPISSEWASTITSTVSIITGYWYGGIPVETVDFSCEFEDDFLIEIYSTHSFEFIR